MKKTKELIRIRNSAYGAKIASVYDSKNGIFYDEQFHFYTKKQLIAALRAGGVIVPSSAL